MARTKIPGGYISDGAITSDHLHASHGITTTNIGEGTNQYFTDARVMTSMGSVNVHILPSVNETYDLGSASLRWKDLFLSGTTINLGGTKFSKDSNGDIEIKDSSDNPKKIKVSEIEFDDGTNVRRLKISGGKIKSFDGSDAAVKLDLSSSTTSDIAEGTNLYFTNARADARITAADTGDLSEGSNLYFTNARARAAISGTGSLSYNSTTGVMSFTMPAQNSDNITEGTSNLYFTNARVGSYLSSNGYATQSTVIAAITDSAPSTLDTLNELAAALGDDANFSTTVTNSIATKLPLAGGTMTGTLAMGANAITSTGTISSGDITSSGTIYVTPTVARIIVGPQGGTGDVHFGSSGIGSPSSGSQDYGFYAAHNAYRTSTGAWKHSRTSTIPALRLLGSAGVSGGNQGFSFDYSANVGSGDITWTNLIQIATSGNATFAGTISSGAITSTGTVTATGGNSTNWNTAYGWGNHASQSYITNSTASLDANKITSGVLNADRVLSPANGDWWNGGCVKVGTDGVMEVGKYLDFHTADSGGNADYDLRVTASAGALTVGGTISATGGNSTNWNTAYGWGNHASAGYITGNQTITLSGDVSGSGTTSIAVTVADDSHNHVISNIDGLQTALDAKLASSSYTAADVLTKIKTVDSSGSGLDADLLDGQEGSYYAQASLSNNKTYTSGGNAAGSYLGGHYSSGGTEKPNSSTFGAGKLKLAMLSPTNLGFGGSWNDVLWMSSYSGGDVKKSVAIVSSKYDDTSLWVAKQNYDSASWGTGYLLWNTGNDGSGSGLDADTVDGNEASAFILKGTQIASGAAWTTATRFGSVGEISQAAGNHALSVRSELGNDAFMSFHIGSDYAVHFGLDGASNRLYVGGWSDGTGTQYQMYDSRDGSAANWNTAYGWGNHASAGYLTAAAGYYTKDVETISTTSLVLAEDWSSGTYHGQFVIQGTYPSWETRGTSAQPYGWLHHQDATGNYTLYSIAGYTGSNWTQRFTFNHADQTFRNGGPTGNVYYHQGNDGSGSGLDADLLDGLQLHTGRNNEVNKVVRTDVNGYIQAGWINTLSGDMGATGIDRIYCSNDGYIRYKTPTNFRNSMIAAGLVGGTSGKGTTNIGFASTANSDSGFYDVSSSGTPTATWYSMVNMAHYGTNHGHQIAGSFYSAGDLYNRNNSNTSLSAWAKIWNTANDGAGSGLDADLLDGMNSSSSVVANTIVAREANGYIYANHINFNTSETENPTINSFFVSNGDGWSRKASKAHVVSQLGVLPLAGGTTSGTITLGTQNALVANNYGRGLFGVYSATRYQHVWSMGTAYKTSDDGTSYGNMYGLTYTHTNIGTGTNESISGLSHQLQGRANGTLWWSLGNGIWTVGNITAYSDIAVKTNLVRIPNALEKVCSINGYTYERTDYVKDPEDKEAPDVLRQAGVVAQEIEKVLPEVVSGKEGNKAVAYGNIVALLIESIKELKGEVDDLKKQLEEK